MLLADSLAGKCAFIPKLGELTSAHSPNPSEYFGFVAVAFGKNEGSHEATKIGIPNREWITGGATSVSTVTRGHARPLSAVLFERKCCLIHSFKNYSNTFIKKCVIAFCFFAVRKNHLKVHDVDICYHL